jgi:hypothetical protein
MSFDAGQETDEAGRGTARLPHQRMPTHDRHKGASPSAVRRDRLAASETGK